MEIKNMGFKVFVTLFIVGFVVLISQRDKMNCMIATYNINFNKPKLTRSDSAMYMAQFNITSTKYKLSLIELGGQGCKPCKKMEAVLLEIDSIYNKYVNLSIINVTKGNDKKAAAYFGIRFIPVQIILDKNGKELYRHSGFISKEELQVEISKYID